MNRIKKGDEVIAIAGKSKGLKGKVISLLKNKVIVEGLNIAKKHVKANPQAGVQGGIVDKAMPIHISNVMLVNPATGKGDRVGFRGEGRNKVRYFKSNNEAID